MSNTELSSKVKTLRELRHMADELAAEIDALTDAIKGEMTAQGVDVLSGSDWRITWQNITSNRLDTAALKKAHPDIAQAFTRQTTSRRFVLA